MRSFGMTFSTFSEFLSHKRKCIKCGLNLQYGISYRIQNNSTYYGAITYLYNESSGKFSRRGISSPSEETSDYLNKLFFSFPFFITMDDDCNINYVRPFADYASLISYCNGRRKNGKLHYEYYSDFFHIQTRKKIQTPKVLLIEGELLYVDNYTISNYTDSMGFTATTVYQKDSNGKLQTIDKVPFLPIETWPTNIEDLERRLENVALLK